MTGLRTITVKVPASGQVEISHLQELDSVAVVGEMLDDMGKTEDYISG